MTITIEVEDLLLFLSVLFLSSLFATKVGSRFGVPVLLLFLGVGMFFGVDGIGVEFQNYTIAKAVGTVALCIILFSGGLDTKYQDIRPVAKQGIILSTLGVLLMAFFTGIFIYYLTQIFFPSITLSFLESLLLASVMSSTDSASVFSILRGKGVRLKKRLRSLLELESGSNDPMAYLLTITLISLIKAGDSGNLEYGTAAINFLKQFTVGCFAGFILGKAGIWVINRIKLGNDSLYPILIFSCGIFIFSVTHFVNGNGYLAVYIGGLVIGNARIVHKRSSMQFFDGLAWISQMVMFLTLGLLINPSELMPIALVSLIIGVFMIIGSRPLSVFISLLPFSKMGYKEKLFVSWVGLRGAVPIIFAILPLSDGLAQSRLMFNIVFFLTLLSLLVQGTTLTWFARVLGLAKTGSNANNLEHFGLEFSEEIKSTMTEITVNDEILSAGNRLMDITLPDHTLVVMTKREDHYFIPKGETELHVNDKLLIITNDEKALLETYKNLGINQYGLRRN